MTDDLVALITGIAQDLNAKHATELAAPLDSDTPLFGRHGILDSLGLVSLVVAVEQAIEDKYGVAVSLADEKAMSQTKSPYRTVGSLAEYARRLIPETTQNG